MINPYCKSFSGFFAELAYYGLIKEEDAQCFRTDVMVEPTFLFLVGAAIALALLNSFVMSSTSQFFHDCDRYQIVCVQEQTDGDVEYLDDFIEFEESFQSDTARKQTIHPVPVLFTDRYRWFLHREDAVPSRRPSETLGSIGQDTPSDERISPNGNVSTMSPGGYDSDERSSCVEESEHGRLNDAWSEQDFDFDQSTRMSNMGDQTDGDIVTIHGQADMSTVSGNVTVDDPQTFSLASTSSTSSRRLRL